MEAQLANMRNSKALDEEYCREVGEYGVTIGVIPPNKQLPYGLPLLWPGLDHTIQRLNSLVTNTQKLVRWPPRYMTKMSEKAQR